MSNEVRLVVQLVDLLDDLRRLTEQAQRRGGVYSPGAAESLRVAAHEQGVAEGLRVAALKLRDCIPMAELEGEAPDAPNPR